MSAPETCLGASLDGTTLSKVEIGKAVLDGIPENGSVILRLAMVKSSDGGIRFWGLPGNTRIWDVDAIFHVTKQNAQRQ